MKKQTKWRIFGNSNTLIKTNINETFREGYQNKENLSLSLKKKKKI